MVVDCSDVIYFFAVVISAQSQPNTDEVMQSHRVCSPTVSCVWKEIGLSGQLRNYQYIGVMGRARAKTID